MSTTTTSAALGAPLPGGLRRANFFNGRLLTGDDLSGEQAAARATRVLIGRAAGRGVAVGLEVAVAASSSLAQPTVRVTSGLAVNGVGDAISLAADVELGLTAPAVGAPAPAATAAAGFSDCTPPPPTTHLTGSGVYVLVIGPASEGTGSAQLNGRTTTSASSMVGYTVETVQFRLAGAPAAEPDLAVPSLARNRVAHRFLGVTDPRRTAFQADPLAGAATAYGLIDDMLAGSIASTEVPLAVIYWSADDGFRFIDLWAVRRRLIRPAAETRWAPIVEERGRAEGEAMFLQFQGQLADLGSGAILTPATATFERLPPAGFLPLPAGPDAEAAIMGSGFFKGLTTRGPAFIDAAHVDELLRDSFAYPPIDLSSGEFMWLYRVRENAQPARAASGVDVLTPRPALVFASGHIGYRADARFNLARCNYSNYALTPITDM